MCKASKKRLENQNQRKDLLMTAISTIASGIAGISLLLGILYFKERPVEPGHIVEIVFGSLLFFPSFFWFIYTLVFKHFKLDMEDKVKRIVKLTNVITVFSSIVFFILMMEGFAPYITYPLYNRIEFSESVFGKPGTTSSGFSIAFYAICILSGAVFVYILCDHRFYKIYGKHGMLESVFLTAFPAGIIGARLWFCFVLEWDKYSKWTGDWNASNNPFAIWDGGLAIMGGALLGIIVGVLWVIFVKKEIRIREAVDIIVPTILVAQAVGRWGNFFNLEVYGAAMITMQEGFWIPSFVKFEMASISSPGFLPINDLKDITTFYVPLFYVEFITNLAGYYFIRYLFGERKLFIGIAKLVNKSKHNNLSEKAYNTISTAFPKGGCAGLYLMWYGFTRLFLEPLRYSDYEYQASSDSAVMLIFLGLGVIAIFAIYQYVIEPRYPFYKSRRKKYEALEMAAADETAIDTTVETELSDAEDVKNVAEPKDSSKKHKDTGSLNDDF
jgi:phosphatidylglycerol:prolipoprotein diacylglycerol transferase